VERIPHLRGDPTPSRSPQKANKLPINAVRAVKLPDLNPTSFAFLDTKEGSKKEKKKRKLCLRSIFCVYAKYSSSRNTTSDPIATLLDHYKLYFLYLLSSILLIVIVVLFGIVLK